MLPSAWEKALKIASHFSRGTRSRYPDPEEHPLLTRKEPRTCASTVMTPCSVNFTALPTRLRDDLPQAYRVEIHRARQVGAQQQIELEFFSATRPSRMRQVACSMGSNSKGSGRMVICPASILEKSRISLMTSREVQRRMFDGHQVVRCSAGRRVSTSGRSSRVCRWECESHGSYWPGELALICVGALGRSTGAARSAIRGLDAVGHAVEGLRPWRQFRRPRRSLPGRTSPCDQIVHYLSGRSRGRRLRRSTSVRAAEEEKQGE